MLVVEISRKCGDFNVWNDERVKAAFNSGKGTEKHFKEYMNNNKQYCTFITERAAAEAYINANL